MSKGFKLFSIFLVLLIFVLAISKPSEQNFLDRIATDYSNIHPDFQLSSADLVNMGSTQYRSQLIFSTYTYKFGSIEVSYWGAFGSIFSSGYQNGIELEEKTTTIDI